MRPATNSKWTEPRETEDGNNRRKQCDHRNNHTILLVDGDVDGVKFLVIVLDLDGDLEGVLDLGGDLDGVLDFDNDLELVSDFDRDTDDVMDLVGVTDAVTVGLWLGLGRTIGEEGGAFKLTMLPLPSSPYSP
jgi:hypothetical protein